MGIGVVLWVIVSIFEPGTNHKTTQGPDDADKASREAETARAKEAAGEVPKQDRDRFGNVIAHSDRQDARKEPNNNVMDAIVDKIKGRAPNCNDNDVRKLVIQIAQENSYCYSGDSCNIKNIRITDINKDTGKYECAADLIRGRSGSTQIIYTSELVDRGDRFYVAAYCPEVEAGKAQAELYNASEKMQRDEYFAEKKA